MPHNLTRRPNGQFEFAYVGESPWHRLGRRLEKVATKQEMLKAAGIDFLVERQPLYLGDGRLVSSHVANVRSDTQEVLGIVGRDYRLVQNAEMFGFIDSLVQTAEAKYHTAGSVRGGREVFASAKLPGHIRVVGDDLVEKFLLGVNAHDGSLALHLRWTDIRVVCDNTLTAAKGQGCHYQYTVRHVGDLDTQLAEARRALGVAERYFRETEQCYQALAAKQITSEHIERFLVNFLPLPLVGDKATSEALQAEIDYIVRARDRVRTLVEIGVGTELPGVRGTVWGLYNAATEWVDHVRTARKDHTMRQNAPEAAVLGVGQDYRNKAMKAALALL